MPEPIERERPDLSNGGLVSVILGEGGDLPIDYAMHKQVLAIEGWKIDHKQVATEIPENTRAVVFGGGDRLPRLAFEAIHELLKRRRTPYILRNNTEGVKDALDSLIPPPNRPRLSIDEHASHKTLAEKVADAEKQAVQARGATKQFILDHIDTVRKKLGMNASISEQGRELMKLAQRQGFQTTVGSLQQGVRMYTRDDQSQRSKGKIPDSVKAPTLLVKERIDRAIEAAEATASELRACLDYIEQLEKQNAELRARAKKVQDVFAAFSGDLVGEA